MAVATVDEAEANAAFSKWVDRAGRGERITITRAGVPVAVLGPLSEMENDSTEQAAHEGEQRANGAARDATAIARAIAELKELRKGNRLDGLSLQDLIAEGRR